MNITLEKSQTEYRELAVDGERWATIIRESHGVHGSTYYFKQLGNGQTIMRKLQNGRERRAEVRSRDSRETWRTSAPIPPTISENIITTARQLIADGLLVRPEVARALADETERQYSELMAKGERKRRADFEKRALDAIEPYLAPLADREEAVASVIAAMKWAQQQ